MYVVEAIRRESHSYPEVETVYEFVGNEDEVKKFKQNIGSLILGAISVGDVSCEDGQHMLNRLQSANDILVWQQSIFEMTVEKSDTYMDERLHNLTTAAAAGELALKDLWEEFESLDEFYPRGSGGITWLDKHGLVVHLEGQELDVYTQDDLAGVWGKDSDEYRVAQELGLDTEAFQHEVVRDNIGRAKVLSDREHSTLGRFDEAGNFVPIATVINRHDSEPRPAQNTVTEKSNSPELQQS